MREFSVTAYRWLSERVDVPLLVGETSDGSHLNTADFIASGCATAVRTSANHRGGMTGAMRIAHLADSFPASCRGARTDRNGRASVHGDPQLHLLRVAGHLEPGRARTAGRAQRAGEGTDDARNRASRVRRGAPSRGGVITARQTKTTPYRGVHVARREGLPRNTRVGGERRNHEVFQPQQELATPELWGTRGSCCITWPRWRPARPLRCRRRRRHQHIRPRARRSSSGTTRRVRPSSRSTRRPTRTQNIKWVLYNGDSNGYGHAAVEVRALQPRWLEARRSSGCRVRRGELRGGVAR